MLLIIILLPQSKTQFKFDKNTSLERNLSVYKLKALLFDKPKESFFVRMYIDKDVYLVLDFQTIKRKICVCHSFYLHLYTSCTFINFTNLIFIKKISTNFGVKFLFCDASSQDLNCLINSMVDR